MSFYRRKPALHIPLNDTTKPMLAELGPALLVAKALHAVVCFIRLSGQDALLRGECQICGRMIGHTNGVIAHHGYTRPGDGYQTSSCWGAREQAYELSCERVKLWLAHLVDVAIPQAETVLADLRPGCMAPLFKVVQVGGAWNKKTETIKWLPGEKKHNGWTYEDIRNSQEHHAEQELAAMKTAKETAEQRIKNWKPRPLHQISRR